MIDIYVFGPRIPDFWTFPCGCVARVERPAVTGLGTVPCAACPHGNVAVGPGLSREETRKVVAVVTTTTGG